MSLTGNEDLEQRCRALADTVPLPQPFTVQGLLESVERMTGMQIISLPPPSVGLTVSGRTRHLGHAFQVEHPDGEDTWSLLVTCHEIGHILGNHLLPPGPEVREKLELQARELSYFKDNPLLHSACRNECTAEREKEAEVFATLLVCRITEHAAQQERWAAAKPVSPTQRRAIGRFADILAGKVRPDG